MNFFEEFESEVDNKGAITTRVIIATMPGDTIVDKYLFHKLNKHTGNYRKHAQYLKEYFEYYLNKGEDKKAIVLKLQGFGYSADGKIRVNAPEGKELMVGYIHEDGTYHWF